MRGKIAIYVHPAHRFQRYYVLRSLAELWLERGFEFEVIQGPDKVVDSDLAFLHVDLTEIPELYRRLVERCPLIVNGRRSSLAKRVISRNLVGPDDRYPGPVIVKTNCNHAGLPDDLARGWRHVWEPSRRVQLDRRLPRWLTGGVFATDYHVYDSIAEVPRIAWFFDRLVVEKFLPERDNGLYSVRTWEFLGGQDIIHRNWSPAPVVRDGNAVRIERIEEPSSVMAVLQADRHRLGLDFGKLDYTIVNGVPQIHDATATTGISRDPVVKARVDHALVDGIEYFIDQARRAGSGR
jgi:hypothetical protein